MQLLRYISIFTALFLLTNSCSVNRNLIQKRKYQKGFHVSVKKKNTYSVINSSSETSGINDTRTQQHKVSNTEVNIDKTLAPELTLNRKDTENSKEEVKESKSNKFQKVEQSFSSIKSKVHQTIQSVQNTLPSKVNNKEGITSKSIFNSDVLTVIIMILLLACGIVAFQIIEGSTGLLIGLALLIGVIVIMAT